LNESHESGTKLIAAGSDTAELLELVEEALDIVALMIEDLCPTEAFLAPDHVGNIGDSAAKSQAIAS
jgi:hypothetical protein